MALIMGLNAFHPDAACVLLKDGVIVGALEEERISRVKHDSRFPVMAASALLKYLKLNWADVDFVAINSEPKAFLRKKMMGSVASKQGFLKLLKKLKSGGLNRSDRYLECIKAASDNKFRGELKFVEHHKSHMNSAFFCSNFDSAAVVSVDGFGDYTSFASGLGDRNSGYISEITRVFFPHSLGIFYQACTQFLGFKDYGDEYKIMGLSAYGSPKYADKLRDIVRNSDDGGFKLDSRYFNFPYDSFDNYLTSEGQIVFPDLFNEKLSEILGQPRTTGAEPLDQRHMDIAASVQFVFEDVFLGQIARLQRETGAVNLCLAGGCAMNSLANGKVYRSTEFKSIFVQPAAGDAGGALGAAIEVVKSVETKDANCSNFGFDAYLGLSYSDEEVVEAIEREIIGCSNFSVQELADSDLFDAVVDCLCANGVVGWFQGRSEWGARALGNRSILADPRGENTRDLINAKIKFREEFRPFAPAVLAEKQTEWFAIEDDVPFMGQVSDILLAKRADIPAVCHEDGTGRLQTVSLETNKKFHGLITRFYQRTRVPMLLNTSFNENEPIVENPQEALCCFKRTSMDIVVLNNFVISRVALP